MTNERYDVLVIGGGIHGAGVAQAAVAAGYRVLVLEQNNLASGTSSRSSKLIHGGLRYLEHGEFSLVRECLRERALLLKNAPKLVRLQSFFIPVYADSVRNRWFVRAGLTLYCLLGGGGRDTRFRSVPQREWAGLDGLKMSGLRAVFEYKDGQTDDAALTRAVMASAKTLGAQCETQAEFMSALRAKDAEGDCWEIQYRKNEKKYKVSAATIVNAAGPWVNDVLSKFFSTEQSQDVELVQGSHLVLDEKLQRGIYYLESPRDQRPVFVMPWQLEGGRMGEATLLGTTEKHFSGDPATVQPSSEEQAYLLETYEHYFSTAAKVCASFAGLRVLPVVSNSGESQYGARQRETVLQTDVPGAPRLLTIYGGKLTAYRATAEKVVNALQKSLPGRKPIADTRTLTLPIDDAGL